MKGKGLVSLVIIIACSFMFINKQLMINIILSLKYPSPIKYDGFQLPIEKGAIYSKSNKFIRITNTSLNKYSIIISTGFSLPQNESIESYLKNLGHILIQSTEYNKKYGYLEIYSVDREWSFNVTHFFPGKKIIMMYSGKKLDYEKYTKILNRIEIGRGSG